MTVSCPLAAKSITATENEILQKKISQYLETIQYWVKIYISLFLIWRFNFFRKIHFTDLDRKVAFSAGLFLFTTTIFNQILTNYLKEIKAFVKTYINKDN